MDTNKSGSRLYSLNGDKGRDEILLQPYNYISKVPGPEISTELCKAFNHWLNIPEKKLTEIDHIAFTLVNAGIILDDIQDNSTKRKGIPSAHLIYGIGSTLNSGCYATQIALVKSFELGHPDAPRIVVDGIMNILRGIGIEIYWRDNYICPTEEEYMRMAEQKIAFITKIMKLMQLFSESKKDYTTLSVMLGTFWQIHEDYINLFSKDYMDKKGYGDDITEGKFSFPLMHAIHKYPHDKRVIEILKKRTTDYEVKKYCILLKEYGCDEYTRKKLMDLGNEIRKEMKGLGHNPYIEHILNSSQL